MKTFILLLVILAVHTYAQTYVPPTQPSQPSAPVVPPTQPSAPVVPPTQPSTPIYTPPTQPTQPSQPVQPPTQPSTPATPPSTYSPPTQPTQPSAPVTPPTQPSQPVSPPTQPSTPIYTPPTDSPVDQPTQPSQPVQPPTQPSTPSTYAPPTPDQPTQPSQPTQTAPGTYTMVDVMGCNQNYLIHESVSQSFVPPADGPLAAISIWIKPHSCYDTSYHVELLQGDDLLSTSTILGTSSQVDIQASLSGGLAQWYNFTFDNVNLVGGTRYIWRLVALSDNYGAISVCSDEYAGGSAFGQNQQPNPYRDCSFGISMDLPAGNPCDNNKCVSGASCVANGPMYSCKCADDLVGDGTTDGTGCAHQCDVPTALETIDAPTLDSDKSGFSSQNILTLVWDVPIVQTRTDNQVQFLLPDNSVASDCPLSDMDLEVTGDCMKQLTLNLNWADATSKCGCHLKDTVGSGANQKDIYGCSIRFTTTEQVEDTLGSAHSREIVNEFNILITFDNYATVATDIKVFCSVVVDAVLVKQEYGTEQPDAGFFEFETNVGYPFQLAMDDSDTEISTYPDTIQSTMITEENGTYASAFGKLSTQRWKVFIQPKSDTCELDGEYVTGDNQFSLECTDAASNAGDCPENIDHYVVISFKLDSSNYCGQVVADVGVVLEMKSYSDSSYSDDMDVFFIGENSTAYFEVDVASSPQVSVSSLEVLRVVLSSCGLASCHANANSTGTVLYDNGAPTALGDQFSIEVNEDTFSFAIIEAFNVQPTTFDSVNVLCLVKIHYQGNDGQKRSALAIAQNIAPDTTNKPTDHDISISVHNNHSGANSLAGSSLFILLAAAILFFVL